MRSGNARSSPLHEITRKSRWRRFAGIEPRIALSSHRLAPLAFAVRYAIRGNHDATRRIETEKLDDSFHDARDGHDRDASL